MVSDRRRVKCRGRRADGASCGAWATETGYCAGHDPEAIVRKKGLVVDRMSQSNADNSGGKKPDSGQRMADELNARQLAFVDAYATPGSPGFRNATQAAIAAGYDASAARVTGPRLLSHVVVGAAIQERLAAAAEVAGYTRAKYVEKAEELRDAWLDEHGRQRTETVFNRDGQPTGSRVMRPDSANVRAHELIGKAVGYLGDKAGESRPTLIITNVQTLAQQVAPKQEPEGQEPEAVQGV